MTFSSVEIPSFEDDYHGSRFPTYQGLSAQFAEYCEHPLFGRWNIPVWIHSEVPGVVQVGVMLSRHGNSVIWEAPATEDQQTELKNRMLRVWAGRAEQQFARHPALPKLAS